MKAEILLATGLFLVLAPEPDARDIAEMTHNFIVTGEAAGPMASPVLPDRPVAALGDSFDSGNRPPLAAGQGLIQPVT